MNPSPTKQEKVYNNINFFPFYVLIDKDGKIAEYNTVRPSNLMGSHPNLLDKLLK